MTRDASPGSDATPERRRFVPARPALPWRVATQALFWTLGLLVVAGSDLQALQQGMPVLHVARHIVVTALAFGLSIHVAFWLADRLARPLWQRLVLILVLTLAWGAAMQPVQDALGFLGGLGGAEFDHVATVGVALSTRAALRGLRTRRKLARATQLRAQAEQRLLGMQLAPHTLFNMLNTLYAVALTRPDDLAPLVADLSSMMRDLTEGERHDYHAAQSEWRFIESYRRFALARAAPASTIAITISGDASRPVPAFLAATLFENAVKHGSDADGRLDVSLALELVDDGFKLRIRNRLGAPGSPPGLQAGMDLVRRRLGHLFAERHRLVAGAQAAWYVVELDAWK
jgi:hypothetical protein